MPKRSGERSRRTPLLLLSATLTSLILTIVAGDLSRRALIDASAWVTHTQDVKLAIDECQRAIDRSESDALRNAMARLARLTLDNPRQQRNSAQAAQLLDQGAQVALDDLFASMRAEEDRLMADRLERNATARARSVEAFVVGAILTVLFGAGAFALFRAQRQDIARQRALLEAILESVDEGVIAVEPSARGTIAMNAVARTMVGRTFPRDHLPDDWSAHLRATFEDGSAMPPQEGPLARALRGETSENVVYRLEPTGDATAVWVSTTARPIRDDHEHVVAAVATLRDITEQRANVERLRDLSLTDDLTGLLNRRGFVAMAEARIALARRSKAPVALLYADVNGLKRINDELGHEQGDRVIEDAARALRTVFRDGDVVARIGGDEFVALLPNFSAGARDALLERIAASIRAQAERQPRAYRLSVSAGVTFMDWEKGQSSLEELLADADRTMYARKRERAGQSAPYLRAVPSA